VASARHPWASASFWIGATALVLGVAVVVMFLSGPGSPVLVLGWMAVLALTFVLGMVAVLLGIVGLFRREGARAFGGVAIGLVALLPTAGLTFLALLAVSNM